MGDDRLEDFKPLAPAEKEDTVVTAQFSAEVTDTNEDD